MRTFTPFLALAALIAFTLCASSLQAAPPKVIEFENAPLADALRQLARDAKVHIVLDEEITGTTSIRLEDVTPLEALRVLADSKGLALDESASGADIYFVTTARHHAERLGYLDGPSLPEAVARYKHRLYQALRHEGFTDQQALAITAADRTPIADVPVAKP